MPRKQWRCVQTFALSQDTSLLYIMLHPCETLCHPGADAAAVPDDDLVLYEPQASHRSSHAAVEPAQAAAAEDQEQQFDAQEAEAHGAR
jgi:hypothetical protein